MTIPEKLWPSGMEWFDEEEDMIPRMLGLQQRYDEWLDVE